MQLDIALDPEANVAPEDNRRNLRRIARFAEWTALAGLALVLAYCAYLTIDRGELLAFLKKDAPLVAVEPSDAMLTLAYVISLGPVAIFAAAMWEARRFFRLFGKVQIFDPAAPRLLVRLGGLAIAGAVTAIVTRTLVVLAMTSANPPGQKQLLIGIGSGEIASVIVGLLFFAFSLVMREALRLEAENRSFL
jgi:Protein of unknown function (DUF2975)